MNSGTATLRQQEHPSMDTGVIVAIAGVVGALFTAFTTGMWNWLSGRRKSGMDAQASLVTGFVALLAEFKNERTLLIARINELEAHNQRQDRHIARLVRIMIENNIPVPPEEETAR